MTWAIGPYPEMAAAFGFSLDQYLFFGGYPGVAEEIGDLKTWRTAVQRTIISPGIERDVIALSRVEKPALLRRLMELGAEYSGQILSYNKMLGQLQEAREHDDACRLPRPLLSGAGLVTGLSGYSAAPYIARGVEPEAERPQHGPDDGPAQAFLRGGPRRPYPLGPDRGKLGGSCTSTTRPDSPWICTTGAKGRTKSTSSFPAELIRWASRSRAAPEGAIAVGRKRSRSASRGPERFWSVSGGCLWRSSCPSRRGTGWTTKPAPPRVREPTPKYGGKTGVSTWNQPIVPGWKESEDYTKQAERRKFMADARRQVAVLERGEGSPWLWHRNGRAYICAIPGHFNGDPTDTLRVQAESDERLLDSALKGLPGFVHRDDLPPLTEIVRLDGTKEGDSYSYPVLASLAETARLGGNPLCGLGREGITRAVGSYYLADYVKEPPWYPHAIDQHPDRCADALVTVYRSAYPAPRQT